MDTKLFIANIAHYCRLKNEPVTTACTNAGVGKSFVNDIRRGRSPRIAAVYDLAQYLGCSVSDLVGDNKNARPDTQAERNADLKFLLDQMSPDQMQSVVQDILRRLSAR